MSNEAHPYWCHPASCTAFGEEMDRQYHRSEPVIIGTVDPGLMIYVHRGANPDGSGEYVELAEFEEPILEPWYLNPPCANRGTELNMALETADELHTAIRSLRAA